MTAEVVIMNKSAVAMAADSAVTIDEGKKIYNSVNKLFSLSKYHPVGIMIYGNGEFLDYPWESVIKEFRRVLGPEKKGTIKEYAERFISFLENEKKYFGDTVQEKNFKECVGGYYSYVKARIKKTVQAKIASAGKLTESEVKEIASAEIKVDYDNIEKTNRLSNYSPEYHSLILEKYGKLIQEILRSQFQNLPLAMESKDQLTEIAAKIFYTDIFHEGMSGVVVSGFGEDEIFPATIAYEIEGIVADKVKYKILSEDKIDVYSTGAIMPFAQQETVSSFIEGFHPSYESILQSYFRSMFSHYPKRLLESIPTLDAKQREEILKKQEDLGKKMFDQFEAKLEEFKAKKHVNPILEAVSNLPKDELASMAEALVNLTSFKRRISMDLETVGGPIDVAVISKGDGFIWIKRKHYFKPDLNYSFFQNYFEKDK